MLGSTAENKCQDSRPSDPAFPSVKNTLSPCEYHVRMTRYAGVPGWQRGPVPEADRLLFLATNSALPVRAALLAIICSVDDDLDPHSGEISLLPAITSKVPRVTHGRIPTLLLGTLPALTVLQHHMVGLLLCYVALDTTLTQWLMADLSAASRLTSPGERPAPRPM